MRAAETAFDLSLKTATAANDQAAIAHALRQLGGASGMQGKFAPALDYFRRAAAIFEQTGDEAGLMAALRGVGNAESSIGNYENGLAAFRKLLALAEKTNDKRFNRTRIRV